ncbi:Uncharacterised protein [uncultured archaeon]|nr:Uncharacterised protein [uncultured archaeon]
MGENSLKEVEEYLANRDKLLEVTGEKSVKAAIASAKEQKITDGYDEIIANLKKEKDARIKVIHDEAEQEKSKLDAEIDSIGATFKDVDFKLKILNAQKEIEEKTATINVDTTKFSGYNNHQIIWLPDLFRDKYLHLVLCIAENDKPKNKYSLMVYGRCAFTPLMDLQTYYSGVNVNTGGVNPNVEQKILDAPTIEELKRYAEKHRAHIYSGFLQQYRATKEEYEETISKYKLTDFEAISTIREVADKEAPIVFTIKSYKSDATVRIYNKYYYSSDVEKNVLATDFKAPDNRPAWEKIKVDGVIYNRLCRVELMVITETGNTMFGDWWSTSIEETGLHGSLAEKRLFNKENWEENLTKTEAWLKETCKERYTKINWNPPQIVWVHPELLPKLTLPPFSL